MDRYSNQPLTTDNEILQTAEPTEELKTVGSADSCCQNDNLNAGNGIEGNCNRLDMRHELSDSETDLTASDNEQKAKDADCKNSSDDITQASDREKESSQSLFSKSLSTDKLSESQRARLGELVASIIDRYIEKISKNPPPKVISGAGGAFVPLPPKAPTTIQEATAIARNILNGTEQ